MSINSIAFPEDETDRFYVGSEDQKIYQANLHQSNQGGGYQVPNIHNWPCYPGHHAPITALSMHPGKSMNDSKGNTGALGDMSELLLSASMDWTVSLWYPKNENLKTPIFTFESSQEYVYDV